MKKTIFDLPEDLVEDEIFSRVPMTSLRSVRSTCRKWNVLCKNRILFGKAAAEAKNQFMMMDSRMCLVNFDLRKDRPSIQISKVFQCNWLKDCSRLLVWNPYLGKMRWIEPRHSSFRRSDRFSLGYDNNNNNNLNYHKILRIFDERHPVISKLVLGFELYCFTSSSWKVLDVVTLHWLIWCHLCGVSLKGNAYFLLRVLEVSSSVLISQQRGSDRFCLCRRFTLTMEYILRLYLVLERSSSLYLINTGSQKETVEISIGPYVVSWTKFLKLVTSLCDQPYSGSFFIDEEKKIAVFFVLEEVSGCHYQSAHVVGQDGYFKSVRIREAPYLENSSSPNKRYYPPVLCSSYLPSLLQLNQPD
ncbi:hypothetical protein Bca101_080871 [Brassica carinata]